MVNNYIYIRVRRVGWYLVEDDTTTYVNILYSVNVWWRKLWQNFSSETFGQ